MSFEHDDHESAEPKAKRPAFETHKPTGKALVVVPVLRDGPQIDEETGQRRLVRLPDARLEEAIGLTAAIDLEIVHASIVNVDPPRPATLMGSGKVEELAEICAENGVELAIVDHALTPVQQRNLEKELKVKVLDRTGLILEIFGRRARTREGVLQVDLAHLNYQKGRLVRSWTHLERQRGGAGFLGGPGETQIEADRRALQEKIIKLKRELERVQRTRELHRAKRKKIPFPVAAIVGYTNAGKSTLFNHLTGAEVLAQDMLFATLDPTLRRVVLPSGTKIILSDTVGFISNLPTHLIAAFRATLEEVVEADLILHVRDIADADSNAQADDVRQILSDLGIDASDEQRVIEVWNKVDLLDENARETLADSTAVPGRAHAPVPISAVTGEGLDRLVDVIESRISGHLEFFDAVIPADQLNLIDWIYRNGNVLERDDREDGSVALTLSMPSANRQTLERRLSGETN